MSIFEVVRQIFLISQQNALTTIDFNSMPHSTMHTRLWKLIAGLPEDVAYTAEI
jgi:hypothetical protein